MAKRVRLDVELPDELFAELRQEEIETKVKEALVMELLREHRLSQGKAAEILGIGRHELFDLMTNHRVPVIDLNTPELRKELSKPLPRPYKSHDHEDCCGFRPTKTFAQMVERQSRDFNFIGSTWARPGERQRPKDRSSDTRC